MSQNLTITPAMLTELYERVQSEMSEKRFRHTAAVAEMVGRLAELYCPHKRDMLTAAALLHDVTKEWKSDRHEAFLQSHGEIITPVDKAAPKTYHARTAALIIPELYPAFASDEIISCVRYHTTGRANMTLEEKLVYLADYIDDTRTFSDCVILRQAFWDAQPQHMTQAQRLRHLDRVMLLAFDMTVRILEEEGTPLHPDTHDARQYLLATKQD